ncbi:hypothetical protein GI482_00365 [Bacillus sp. N3536]|nr:hypothetical protein GI482_00365 [Bacillus sp. N3536]
MNNQPNIELVINSIKSKLDDSYEEIKKVKVKFEYQELHLDYSNAYGNYHLRDKCIYIYCKNIDEDWEKIYLSEGISLEDFYKVIYYHELGHVLDDKLENDMLRAQRLVSGLNSLKDASNEIKDELNAQRRRQEKVACEKGLMLLTENEESDKLKIFFEVFNDKYLTLYNS